MELLIGPSPTLSWVGIGFVFIGLICIALAIGYTNNFAEDKVPFALFLSFLAFFIIFNCVLIGIGINELADRRNLINTMELSEYIVWDLNTILFLKIHWLGIWIAASASNAPSLYSGLTSLLVISILLFIIAIYLGKQSAETRSTHAHKIKHKPRSSTPKSNRVPTNAIIFL
ncbi:MAG: hypothetical protein ACTSO9_15190 [Candidatus Helarchaeota archaeon]